MKRSGTNIHFKAVLSRVLFRTLKNCLAKYIRVFQEWKKSLPLWWD